MVKKPEETIVRAKGTFDGCRSIDEMVQAAEGLIDFLQKLKGKGWELEHQPVEDDYAFLVRMPNRGR